jgi:hypothetical protein
MAFRPSWTDPGFPVVREALQGFGGLASQADLGRRWGISRQRVHQLTREVDFPKPVATISGRGPGSRMPRYHLPPAEIREPRLIFDLGPTSGS